MRHPLRTLLYELFVAPVQQCFQRAFEVGHRLALSEATTVAATVNHDVEQKKQAR